MQKQNEEFFCRLYPKKGCSTCASTCYDESNPFKDCPYWTPSRGGTPSTPMPCEGRNDLCWDEECLACPHAKRYDD